jgi:hypothetical protein
LLSVINGRFSERLKAVFINRSLFDTFTSPATKRKKPLHINPMPVKIIFVLKLTVVGLEDISIGPFFFNTNSRGYFA